MSNRVHVGLELACMDGKVNVAIKADPNPYVEQMTSEAHIYDGHGEKWMACNIPVDTDRCSLESIVWLKNDIR